MQELTPKQQSNRTNARETIETGSYVQTKAFLRKGNYYCFNGAMLDILMSTEQVKSDWKPAFGCPPGNNVAYTLSTEFNPQDILKTGYGMTAREYNLATEFNDKKGMSLLKIAKLFEERKLLPQTPNLTRS